MSKEVCSSTELQGICLRSLKTCPGFEHVNEILIQPREPLAGGTNWTVAAVRPRVSNNVLRAARSTIDTLQRSYELVAGEMIPNRGGRSPAMARS